jgi:hypothetical protein
MVVAVACAVVAPIAAQAGTGQAAAKKQSIADLVKKLQKRPTSIKITKKIDGTIPTGKTIDYIVCQTAQCQSGIQEIQKAAAVLGWKVKAITPASAAPADLQAAFEQADRDKPAGVTYIAVQSSVIGRQLAQLKADKIPVVPIFSAFKDAGSGAIAYPNGPDVLITGYKNLALATGYYAQKAGNKGIGYFPLTGLASADRTNAAVLPALKQACPKCKIKTVTTAIANAATQYTSNIANFFRANPSYKYALIPLDFPGVPAAFQSAGVTGIKVFGASPSPSAGQLYLQSGLQQLASALPFPEGLWQAIDAFARYYASGNNNPADSSRHSIQTWLMSKKTLATGTLVPAVANYQSQFKKLWGKG